MNKKPTFSAKFLEKIDKVHATATKIYQQIPLSAIELNNKNNHPALSSKKPAIK